MGHHRTKQIKTALWLRKTVVTIIMLWISSLTIPALAFVRATTSYGTPIEWKRSCVFITPEATGSDDVPFDAVVLAVAASLDTWNTAATSCEAFISLRLEDPELGLTRGFDPNGVNHNVIAWLENRWGNDQVDYDPAAVALTSLVFVDDPQASDDGEILDVDIELNGVDHSFSATDLAPVDRFDIQNTLTHELGLMLGLSPTCFNGDENIIPRPFDHNGNPVPDCDPVWALTEQIRNATMYNFYEPGEIDKRSLESDDILGVCTIYPPSNDPDNCNGEEGPDGGCRCQSVSHGGFNLMPGLLVVFFLCLLRLSASRRWRVDGNPPANRGNELRPRSPQP